ncbi:MAG: saccharopine dehydrogenase NADP-binding domain-containing protein [Burkholderiaceae bacterium]|jgi:short subunit dehydrogenase-like uncharacterized protein|nr:saccharopine dehydrogenase NADP-binding domain-containing protein [Burkholderiaceae bacterium]
MASMNSQEVLVYGAYGYTGRLIVEALRRRNVAPILAGRDRVQLESLAQQTNLPLRCFRQEETHSHLDHVAVVINAAGPFAKTGGAMAADALRAGSHYIDISNEPDSLHAVMNLSNLATQQARVALPGMGFGTAASNCLLQYILPHTHNPIEASILLVPGVAHRGDATRRTMLEGLRTGCGEFLNGKFVHLNGKQASRSRQLPFGKLTMVSVPMGDAVAAFHSSGIQRIAACIGIPLPPVLAGAALEFGRRLLSLGPVYRRMMRNQTNDATATHPVTDETISRVWVTVRDTSGQEHEAWLEMGESYAFTAESTALAAVCLLGDIGKVGALTPAMAFGAAWLDGMEVTTHNLS